MNTYKIGELYQWYCVDCDTYTTQVYKGVYGGESHMFLCKECGCENCDEIDIRKYPERIMQPVRQALGYKLDDKSHDIEIISMDKNEVFDLVCQWNGLLGAWSDYIIEWVRDIYGAKLE